MILKINKRMPNHRGGKTMTRLQIHKKVNKFMLKVDVCVVSEAEFCAGATRLPLDGLFLTNAALILKKFVLHIR